MEFSKAISSTYPHYALPKTFILVVKGRLPLQKVSKRG